MYHHIAKREDVSTQEHIKLFLAVPLQVSKHLRVPITRNTYLTIASHAGVFRRARIPSLPTNACSTENNIPFPSLANHIVLSKFWKVDLDRKVI